MPYTAPAAVASSAVISKTTFGDVVIADLNFLANPPACRVYHNTTQSVANNSGVIVSFNSERYDTDTMHSTSINTSRVTLTTAGLYLVSFTGEFAAGSDYIYCYAGIRLGGTTDIAYNENYPEQGGNTVDVRINVTTVYKFTAGQYIEALVAQRNTAAAARNLASTGNYSPELSATWIGLG